MEDTIVKLRKRRLKQTAICRRKVRKHHTRVKYWVLQQLQTSTKIDLVDIIKTKMKRLSCYSCQSRFQHRLTGSCPNTYEFDQEFFDTLDLIDSEKAKTIKRWV